MENVHNMATRGIAWSLPMPRKDSREGRRHTAISKKCGIEPSSAQISVLPRHARGSGRQRKNAVANKTDIHSTSIARTAISRQELVEAIARVSRQDRAAFARVYAAT